MKKNKIFNNYFLSIFNPFGSDSGLHFFIKSILALIYGFILIPIVTLLLSFLIFGKDFSIPGGFIISIILVITLQLTVASRRFRAIGKNQWYLIIYLLSMFTGILGIIYFIYLCFAKTKLKTYT